MILTVYIEEIPLECHFDVEPGQPEIRYPNDKAQPGLPPMIELTAVLLAGHDILEPLNTWTIDKIEDELFKETFTEHN